MKVKLAALLLGALSLPSVAIADQWRYEGDQGRWPTNWYGETPDWVRGRDYWDGHVDFYPPPVVSFHEYYLYPAPALYDPRGYDNWRFQQRRDWDED